MGEENKGATLKLPQDFLPPTHPKHHPSRLYSPSAFASTWFTW